MYNPNKYEGTMQSMPENVEMGNCVLPGVESEPIMECPREKVCHREIHHCVEHVQPIHTRIINHHIYHHKCVPCFTCCEENVVCNVYDNPCCK